MTKLQELIDITEFSCSVSEAAGEQTRALNTTDVKTLTQALKLAMSALEKYRGTTIEIRVPTNYGEDVRSSFEDHADRTINKIENLTSKAGGV